MRFEKLNAALLIIFNTLLLSFVIQINPARNSMPLWLSGLTVAISFLFLLVGFIYLFLKRLPAFLIKGIKPLATWWDVQELQALLLLTGLLFTVWATNSAGFNAQLNYPFIAITSWVIGIVLVIYGSWRFSDRPMSISISSAAWAAALFLAAFLLRAYNTAEIPNTLMGDEGSAGLSALRFLNGEKNNLFITGWFSFPSLYFFLQSHWIAMLGRDIPALRLPSALVGALTVSCTYLLTRAMFGKYAGFFAGIFLSGFHFAVHFSRLGLNNVWDSLFFTITLGALWYGWQNNRRTAYLLAGLSLGFSQYFYVSARLLFAILPGWLLLVSLQDRRRLKRAIPDLTIMVSAMLAVLLPLAWFFNNHLEVFMAPLTRVTIMDGWLQNEALNSGTSAWREWVNQLGIALRAYFNHPLRWFYEPGTPLLRPVSAEVFLTGLLILIKRAAKDGRTLLLLLWLAGITITVSMSDIAPASQRYVAAAPAIAIIIGYGVSAVVYWISKRICLCKKWIPGLALMFMLLLSADDVRFYFRDYTPHAVHGGDNTMVAHWLAQFLLPEPEDSFVVFMGYPRMGFFTHPSLQFMVSHAQGEDVPEHLNGQPLELPDTEAGKIIFLFLPEHHDTFIATVNHYPGGNIYHKQTPDGRTLFWLYTLT